MSGWVAERSVDCPKCPHCGCFTLIPIEAAEDGWNHRAGGEHNLVCPACGMGTVGNAAEVEQAKAAQRAWESIR